LVLVVLVGLMLLACLVQTQFLALSLLLVEVMGVDLVMVVMVALEVAAGQTFHQTLQLPEAQETPHLYLQAKEIMGAQELLGQVEQALLLEVVVVRGLQEQMRLPLQEAKGEMARHQQFLEHLLLTQVEEVVLDIQQRGQVGLEVEVLD
jgi:hypothetical protein